MDLELDGKVFIVTGASAGIGAATATLLTGEGAHVVGVARKPPDGGVAADLIDPAAAQRVVDTALERHGRLDGLVNNAGALVSRIGFLDVTDDQWHATFELNFHAAVRMARAALPALIDQGAGSIVHVSSEAGRFPDTPLVDYAASKTALLSVSKTLAGSSVAAASAPTSSRPALHGRGCGTSPVGSPNSSPPNSAFR